MSRKQTQLNNGRTTDFLSGGTKVEHDEDGRREQRSPRIDEYSSSVKVRVEWWWTKKEISYPRKEQQSYPHLCVGRVDWEDLHSLFLQLSAGVIEILVLFNRLIICVLAFESLVACEKSETVSRFQQRLNLRTRQIVFSVDSIYMSKKHKTQITHLNGNDYQGIVMHIKNFRINKNRDSCS